MLLFWLITSFKNKLQSWAQAVRSQPNGLTSKVFIVKDDNMRLSCFTSDIPPFYYVGLAQSYLTWV